MKISYVDINECVKSPFVCHQHAVCKNSNGSYSCQCSLGYSGDGKINCTGTVVKWNLFSNWLNRGRKWRTLCTIFIQSLLSIVKLTNICIGNSMISSSILKKTIKKQWVFQSVICGL